MNQVFFQEEYDGFLITIENYRLTEELVGLAIPIGLRHLITIDNYNWIAEILEENGITEYIDSEEQWYIVAEPDDIVVNYFAKVDTKSQSSVYDYLCGRVDDYWQQKE